MSLSHPWILYFLWLLPGVALALIVYHRQRMRALGRFAEAGLLNRLTGDVKRGRRFAKSALSLAALGFMLLALAGPRWGSHYQEVIQKGIDIMILVDVSPSMLVEDVKPNRLERARREISDFLRVVQGDRVGLVAFSGAAFTQCPLTLDYGALQMFLNALRPDLIPVPGTDLGGAIETGISSFDAKSETDKVILLITDGEDNEKRGVQAAREAAKRGVKIFVFGIGDPSGGPIPTGEGKGGFKKDKGGKLILSRLNEQGLRDITSATGGTYARSMAGDLDLDLLYFEGIKSRTEAATLKSGKIKVYEERFTFFVIAAFLFLLFEGLVSESRTRHILLIILLVLVSRSAEAADDPDELYRQGRFTEAEKIYADSDMDNPKDLRYRYNRGCANYRKSDYKGAMAAFSSVLRRTKDASTHFRASYNLGNTAFKQGDFASAATYYTQAILANPEGHDARYNLELTLRELERQKKDKKEGQEGKGEDKGKQDRPDNGKKGEPSKDKDMKDNRQKGESGQGEKTPDKGDAGRDEPRKQETDSPKDRSGKLDPLNVPQGQEENSRGPEDSGSEMDKKRSEALLDNVKENRSKFLKFQIPESKRRGVMSGRAW